MNRSTWHRLLRGITPSALSAVLCVSLAAALTIASAIIQSISIGTSLPDALDGNWGLAYTNNVVQPLATVSSSAHIQMILIILGWGVAGLVVYMGIEFSTHTYRSLQTARKNVHLSGNKVVHGNLQPLMVTALWRLGVIAVFSVIFALLGVPVLRSSAQYTSDLVLGQVPIDQSAVHIPLAILGVALLLHCAVVFLRLFYMRMRLFHDIPA